VREIARRIGRDASTISRELRLYLEFLAARCRANSVLAARFDLKVFFTVVGKPVQGVTGADVLGFITAQRTGARCRANSVLAARFDLKVFFTVVGKPVQGVTAADVLGFITAQRTGARSLPDPLPEPLLATASTAGVSLRTVWRRLSTIAGLYAFLTARGDVPGNPVPGGLPTRRERHRPAQGVPLVRAPRTLPRILAPAEVDALTAALRSHRDRAMVAAMVLGGLRRCEVLGLRLDDARAAQRRLFIASGKGGHQRAEVVASRAKAAGSAR
jgi:integrase/recombinase XerD